MCQQKGGAPTAFTFSVELVFTSDNTMFIFIQSKFKYKGTCIHITVHDLQNVQLPCLCPVVVILESDKRPGKKY